MATRLDNAREMLAQGDYAGAMATARGLLRMGQQIDDAHGLIAQAAMRLKDYDTARKSFQLLAARQPRQPGRWGNLGLMAIEARDFELAESATRQAITLDPANPELHFMLVTVLMLRGRLADMAQAIDATLAVAPRHPAACFARFDLQVRSHPVEQWPGFWLALAGVQLAPFHVALVAQHRLLHGWLTNAPRAAVNDLLNDYRQTVQGLVAFEQTLATGGQEFKRRQAARMRASLQGYLGMFGALLKQPAPVPAANAAPLWLMGDSHSLPPHGQPVTWQGKPYRVHSQLVVGCKLWHLASPVETLRRQALAGRLAAAPADALCVLNFGEIDLRPDEGMWPLARRGPKTWQQLIESTIPPALAWVAAHKGPQPLVVVGVPQPQEVQVAKLPEAERPAYLEFVAAANAALGQAARAQGFGFVDLHGFSAGRPGLFLDGIHLLPEGLPTAFGAHI